MDKLFIFFMVGAIALMIIIAVAVYVHYATTPVSELPAWVFHIFFN